MRELRPALPGTGGSQSGSQGWDPHARQARVRAGSLGPPPRYYEPSTRRPARGGSCLVLETLDGSRNCPGPRFPQLSNVQSQQRLTEQQGRVHRCEREAGVSRKQLHLLAHPPTPPRAPRRHYHPRGCPQCARSPSPPSLCWRRARPVQVLTAATRREGSPQLLWGLPITGATVEWRGPAPEVWDGLNKGRHGPQMLSGWGRSGWSQRHPRCQGGYPNKCPR